MHAISRRPPTIALPLLLAVAVIGYMLGTHRVAPTPASPAPAADLRVAAQGNVLLEYPPGWQRRERGTPVPGLRLAHPLWLSSGRAWLEAGELESAGPGPLPGALLSRLRGLPVVEVVGLAALQALRYRDVRLAGYRQRLELYAVPTPAGGEALLACHAPSDVPGALAGCRQIVASLSLAGQATSDVTPDPAYAHHLAALIGALDGARARARAQMARGSGRARLAREANALAGRFLLAAATLARLETPPVAGAAQVVLARSLIAAAASYRLLARVTRSGTAVSFGQARGRVAMAERAVNGALQDFALLGYGRG